MRVWRICARKRARQAFTGEGARLYGGRWNEPGIAVVYTAGSMALAALETFVHLGPVELPHNLVAAAAEIPDDVAIAQVDVKRLPRNWRRYPAPAAVQRIGMKWLADAATAVLAVPSVVIPAELNYLINPAHPESARIVALAPQPFRFDPRVWKEP